MTRLRLLTPWRSCGWLLLAFEQIDDVVERASANWGMLADVAGCAGAVEEGACCWVGRAKAVEAEVDFTGFVFDEFLQINIR